MESNLVMWGTMHREERRRFSLPDFKWFISFPDSFTFSGEFENGIPHNGSCVPPLFMVAIECHIRPALLAAGGTQNRTDPMKASRRSTFSPKQRMLQILPETSPPSV
jgi:hypothetical protein